MHVATQIRGWAIVLFAICLSLAQSAAAQCSFDWKPGEGVAGVAGAVLAMTEWDPDGDGPQLPMLIAGGVFEVAGDAIASNIAAFDGKSWHALGAGTNAAVHALSVFDGKLIVGGDFDSVGETDTTGVAQWDGTAWTALQGGVNGPVRALHVYGGDLIVGGYFTSAGSNATSGIARWDGNGWHPLAEGVTGVSDMTIYNDDLVVAGPAIAGKTTTNGIAGWNGKVWYAFGAGANHEVNCVSVFEGNLIAGGSFTTIGGIQTKGVAQWNGTQWSALGQGIGGGIGFSQDVLDLRVYQGELVATGRFVFVGDQLEVNRIARWNGNDWGSLGSGLDDDGESLATFNNELFVGGYFRRAGGLGASGLARWNAKDWLKWDLGISNLVNSATVYNGDVIVGGLFKSVDGQPINYIARLNGSNLEPFGAGGMGGNYSPWVTSLTTLDGDLIAGGMFTEAGGVPANHIARWDGKSWHPFGNGTTALVRAMIVYNGDLIASGGFLTNDGQVAQGVARWNGSGWEKMGAGLNGTVHALVIHDDKLIAGGDFQLSGSVHVNKLAQWDGISWTPFHEGPGQLEANSIRALAEYKGELIVGGFILFIEGLPAKGVARWNGDKWQTLGPGLGHIATVYALGTYHDELIAGGGNFDRMGHIARWNGIDWSSLGEGVNRSVHDLVSHDGQLIAVGEFARAGEIVAAGVATWGPSNSCPHDIAPACGNHTIDVDDLLAVINNWGPCSNCLTDFDLNGTTDALDLQAVIEAWGECP